MKEQLKQIFAENADCLSATATSYVMTSDKFIDIFSELMNEVEMKLKEPNFYIVNSKKYLNDEQRISVAEKITQMSTTTTWIEIKSEDDLPKDRGINDTWVIDKNGIMEVLSSNALKWVYSRNHWVNYYTHYQPIHKPQPPNKLH